MKKIIFILLGTIGILNLYAQNQITVPQLILPGHFNDLNAVAFSLKFNVLASTGWDNSINIYSGDTTFKLIKSIPNAHRAQINALKFSKQGNMLVSASNDFVVNVYDSTFKKVKMLVAGDGHTANISSVIFDNSGRVVFSADDEGRIILWSLESQKKIKEINNGVAVNAIAMSGDPRTLFVAGKEPFVKVINASSGKVQRTFEGHTDAINALEISPNQKYLLTGSNDKSARIWDLKTGKEVRKLSVDCWKVTAVAFSFDSKYCATGCNDGSIKIWDVETGNLIQSVNAQGYNTRDLVFLKRYRQLAVAPMLKSGSDYGVRIYPTNLIDPITQSETLANTMVINKFQNAIDSLIKIRPLTKQDSLNFHLIKKGIDNKIKPMVNKTDSVRIYKTPSKKG